MKQLAAAAGVPFILFDSQDPATDRWQPLWGSPDGVAARAVEPIKQSEPYYYDVLRRHLDVVCKVLHAAGMLAPVGPVADRRLPAGALRAAGQARRAARRQPCRAEATRERARHATSAPPEGFRTSPAGVFRLEVALALAGRTLVTPRVVPRRGDRRRAPRRSAPAAGGRDVANTRRHDARRGRRALGARARGPARRRRTGRRAVDAAAGRVRCRDQDGRATRESRSCNAAARTAGR